MEVSLVLMILVVVKADVTTGAGALAPGKSGLSMPSDEITTVSNVSRPGTLTPDGLRTSIFAGGGGASLEIIGLIGST